MLDLFKGGNSVSFEQVKKYFNIPHIFFRYLQVRSFFKTHFPSTIPFNVPQGTWIDEFLNMNPVDRGRVSVLYDNIQKAGAVSFNHIARRWEEELGTIISEADWQTHSNHIGTLISPHLYAIDMGYCNFRCCTGYIYLPGK